MKRLEILSNEQLLKEYTSIVEEIVKSTGNTILIELEGSQVYVEIIKRMNK